MGTEASAMPNYRRATALMTATSVLVPAVGLITAPLLAQGLGADGRGQLAAALGPATLMLGTATLGLPDALTYFVAKHPSITRRALLWSATATLGAGATSVFVVWWFLPFLSAGDEDLARLIFLATVCQVPALGVGVLRGAATGRQMWELVAAERVVLSLTRMVSLFVLYGMGQLTVSSALLVSVAAPALSGIVYTRLVTSPPASDDEVPRRRQVASPLFRYGLSAWFGGVALMWTGQFAGILMVPLSDATELGLYVVATTIADVPILVAMSIQGALFGVSSRSPDPQRVATTARLTVIIATAGCLALGATLPVWLGTVFGNEFSAATMPTLIRLLAAVVMVPGLMASSSLRAWGRPALRSAVLAATLAVNLILFILLVPTLGASGASWAALAGAVVHTILGVSASARTTNSRGLDYVLPRRGDFRQLWHETAGLATKVAQSTRMKRARTSGAASEDAAKGIAPSSVDDLT